MPQSILKPPPREELVVILFMVISTYHYSDSVKSARYSLPMPCYPKANHPKIFIRPSFLPLASFSVSSPLVCGWVCIETAACLYSVLAVLLLFAFFASCHWTETRVCLSRWLVSLLIGPHGQFSEISYQARDWSAKPARLTDLQQRE